MILTQEEDEVSNEAEAVPGEIMYEVFEAAVSVPESENVVDGGETNDGKGEITESEASSLPAAGDREYVTQEAADEADAFRAGGTIWAKHKDKQNVRQTVRKRNGNSTEVVTPIEFTEELNPAYPL